MTKKMAIKKRSNKPAKKIKFGMQNIMKPIMKLVFVFILLFGSGVIVLKVPGVLSSFWPVEKITIVGVVEHVDQKQLAEILLANDFSGMLAIDLQQLREKVIQMPWVKDVQIRKVWPETLSFTFKEHKPIARINKSYLTEAGSLIENKNYLTKQPILQIEINNVQTNKQTDLLALVEDLINIRSNLAEHHLNVEKLIISESNNWLIKLEKKFLINVGRKLQRNRIENFLQVYSAIENKQKLESVDLRYSNGLAVKMLDKPIESGQSG